MREVLSLILGGGRGSRLYPLTQLRSKPAVPVAGKYRLIDIPISNCINSGLNRIYVLTQFLSVSLHRHIANTYKFDPFSRGFVEILAAQQTFDKQDWYQGTADAVRQQIRYVIEDPCREVMILSGDQLYRMDYRQLLRTHRHSGADVTIAVLPVPQNQASGFGLVKLDDTGRVIQFTEKPKTPDQLEPYRTSGEWIVRCGVIAQDRPFLAFLTGEPCWNCSTPDRWQLISERKFFRAALVVIKLCLIFLMVIGRILVLFRLITNQILLLLDPIRLLISQAQKVLFILGCDSYRLPALVVLKWIIA